jgi:hypothetical protein
MLAPMSVEHTVGRLDRDRVLVFRNTSQGKFPGMDSQTSPRSGESAEHEKLRAIVEPVILSIVRIVRILEFSG